MFRRSERGQVLVLFAVIIITVLALSAFVVDGGLYVTHWNELQADLDAACIAAAIGQYWGDDAQLRFNGSLDLNGVLPEFDGLLQQDGSTLRTWLSGPHNFYLAQFMGITHMDIKVQSRCLVRQVGVLPIAVQEPWVEEGIAFGTTEFPILGEGAEAVDAQGADFAGAVLPHIWCENTNCDPRVYFQPATESKSPNIFKSLFESIISGDNGSVLVPIGQRVPQISGVSNKFLVQAMVDAGYGVGDKILVMVYNGVIDQPNAGFGNWENLEIIYYALAEISENTDTNSLWVRFLEAPIYTPDRFEGTSTRTIPWNWNE